MSARFTRIALAVLLGGTSVAAAAGVKVGERPPGFGLAGSEGRTHRLSDYRGKQAVVLAWFPKAFTQGCTIECRSLAEDGDPIKKDHTPEVQVTQRRPSSR